MSAAVLVFVAGLGSEGAARIDAALEETLRARDAATTLEVERWPAEQVAIERAAGAAVVFVASDPELSHVQLRVFAPGDSAGWQDRTLDFGPNDDTAARTRSVGIVTVAMLPEAARSPRPEPPPPSAEPPPRRLPRPQPALPAQPRVEFGAAFGSALGSPSTFGAVGQARVRLLGALWVRAGAGVRAGSAPLQGTALDVPLEIGASYRWPLGTRWTVGGRLDGLVQLRQVTPEDVTLPATRSRWLGAFRAGPEVLVRLDSNFGLAFFAGAEMNFGRTRVQIGDERAAMGLLRAYVEVGPYLTF